MKTFLKSTTILAALVASANASASTIIFGNSKYELVQSQTAISWTDAKVKAEEKGGYLATLTSEAENNYIYDNLVNNHTGTIWKYSYFYNNGNKIHLKYGPWFGLYQEDPTQGTIDPTANWKWVNGEGDLAYENWDHAVLDDAHGVGSESYAHFFTFGDWNPSNAWNDIANHGDGKVYSYIVEYDISEVPVPTAALLFTPALLGFMGLRRKAIKKA
jgi:hypothetical protein